MRRLALLVVVALVLLPAASATAKRVVNEGHTEFQVQAYMGSDNSDGGAWATQGSNGVSAGIDYDANWYCASPTGDLAWVSIHGEATVDTFEVSPRNGKTKFTTGNATGTFIGGNYDYELCDGTQGSWDLSGGTIEIAMDGTGGSLVKTRGSESWHVPSGSNYHRNDRGLMRMANGTVDVPGLDLWEGDGSIGRHSWSMHSNEK